MAPHVIIGSFLGVNWSEAAQLATNGLINGSAYGLLGAGFGLILGVTGRFHFAFALTYTLSAYIAAVVASDEGVNFWLSLLIGLVAGICAGVLIEGLVYRPVASRAGDRSLLTIFVAALGLTIAGENALRLKWGSGSKIIPGFDNTGHSIGSVFFTRVDEVSVATILGLVLVLQALLRFAPLGRKIRATRTNPEMARAVGIEIGRVYLVVFAIGSAFAGVAALLQGVKYAATADMGTSPVFYAFLVAFLAGTRSAPLVAWAVGVGVGLVESLSALWISVQWSGLVVFAVLFLYLCYRSASVSLGRFRLPGDTKLAMSLKRAG